MHTRFRLTSLDFGCTLWVLVGLDGLEPSTSRLSGVRSSHLSYRPVSLRLFSSVHLCCLRWDSEPLTRLRRVVWLLSTTHFQQFSLHDACIVDRKLVEMMGFEPMTPCLQGRCSPNWATPPSGVLSGYLIEAWQLNNKIYRYSRTHSVWLFCPNLTTSAQLTSVN